MPNAAAFPAMLLAAAAMIVLALVWPQGQGAASPAPFGHPLARPIALARPELRPRPDAA